MSLIMEVSQRTVLHTQLLILMILLIILGYSYGTVNEDEPQVQETKQQGIEKADGKERLQERRSKTSDRTCYKNLRWVLGNPQATVAMTDDERLRRARDVGLNNPNNCYPDEYYSEDFGRCRGCTRCSPGTQHDPQLPCGHGQGQETHCTHCEDGYYQNREGLPVLTCQPCSQCDPRAIVESVCTQRSNTVCGKCQEGWYYRENNICEECTEEDIADPSNNDCYQEPVPTPGPKPTPGPRPAPGTRSHLGSLPQPGPSPREPVPNMDEASTKPAVNTVPGEVTNPPPQNILGTWKGLLIAGSTVAAVLLVVVVVLYVKKNKKRKDVPQPPIDVHEMENLYVEIDDRPKEREQGSSGEASGVLRGLVPPSSDLNSSRNESGSSKGDPQECTHDQGKVPRASKNFVTRDTEVPLDTDQRHAPLDDGPLSGFKSLKSFIPVDRADDMSPQDPDMPAEGSQSATERSSRTSTVGNKQDPVGNYDVAKDSSIFSIFHSLSSFLHLNNPRPPKTQV